MRCLYSFGYKLFALLLISTSMLAGAQSTVRDTLFEEANEALDAAIAARAPILAPKSYGLATEHYRRAEELLEGGKGLDRIKSELAEAVIDLKQAFEVTKVAEVSLINAIQARADALSADAPNYAAQRWQDAEDQFARAGIRLEEGSLKSSKRYADKAETLYRKAELAAIKANYLNETQALLERAEKAKAKRYAPKTLENAQRLFAEAEQGLNEDRYDTDQPRSLAQSAKHEARLAIYLAETLAVVDKNKTSMEDVLLDWQTPLKQIGANLDLSIHFDDGYQSATAEITQRVDQLYAADRSFSHELSERKTLIRDLEQQIAELEARLGGVSQERLALNMQLERQANIRARFREVEQLFDREDAMVLRSGNNVILRLVGLTFDSGQAVIKPERFALLTKVQNAVRIFPQSSLVVEGHTDSFGGDEANLALSEQRAEATRSYLLANMGLDPNTVVAVGYGEARPVANNEIPEGRVKNRRIDVVIKPIL